jgi:hypothetical protein
VPRGQHAELVRNECAAASGDVAKLKAETGTSVLPTWRP